MKTKIMTIAILVCGVSLSGLAQVPPVINYQGRLTSQTGAPLFNVTNNAADGQIDLVFRIYDAPAAGNIVWSQTNADVAVYNGLFSVLLTNLNETNFPATNQVNRWLEVEVRTSSATNTLAPAQRARFCSLCVQGG